MNPLFVEPKIPEVKPAFDDIPEDILKKIGRRLAGEVVAGETVYGSFSASAGYVLTLDSSLKIFAKGTHPGEMAHGTQHLRQEIAAYENLPVLKDVSPGYYSFVTDNDEDGWSLGLWEYIRHDPLKHATTAIDDIMSLLVKVHQSAVPPDVMLPARAQNYISGFFDDEKKWRRIKDEEKTQEKFLTLFDDVDKGRVWLNQSIETLTALQTDHANSVYVEGLIHGDLRMDNVIFGQDRIYFVDWPNVCVGPVVFDLVFISAHLESLGIGKAEDFIAAYAAAGGKAFTSDASTWDELCRMLAAICGYFADQAYRAIPEKLPRLRWMQKSMLLAGLNILSRFGKIESPPPFAGEAPRT
jgi:hypothetical protein